MGEQSKELVTHPADVKLYAIRDDDRQAMGIVTRDEGQGLDDVPIVHYKLRKFARVPTAELLGDHRMGIGRLRRGRRILLRILRVGRCRGVDGLLWRVRRVGGEHRLLVVRGVLLRVHD